jgi:hypothetical protein
MTTSGRDKLLFSSRKTSPAAPQAGAGKGRVYSVSQENDREKERRGQLTPAPPALRQKVIADDDPADDLGHVHSDFDLCPEAHDEALGSRRAADPKVATRPLSNE